jgi:hypothetical protein
MNYLEREEYLHKLGTALSRRRANNHNHLNSKPAGRRIRSPSREAKAAAAIMMVTGGPTPRRTFF